MCTKANNQFHKQLFFSGKKKSLCRAAEVNRLFNTLMDQLHSIDCYYSNDDICCSKQSVVLGHLLWFGSNEPCAFFLAEPPTLTV